MADGQHDLTVTCFSVCVFLDSRGCFVWMKIDFEDITMWKMWISVWIQPIHEQPVLFPHSNLVITLFRWFNQKKKTIFGLTLFILRFSFPASNSISWLMVFSFFSLQPIRANQSQPLEANHLVAVKFSNMFLPLRLSAAISVPDWHDPLPPHSLPVFIWSSCPIGPSSELIRNLAPDHIHPYLQQGLLLLITKDSWRIKLIYQ